MLWKFIVWMAGIVVFLMLIAIVAIVAYGIGWIMGAAAEEPEGELDWLDALAEREVKKL